MATNPNTPAMAGRLSLNASSNLLVTVLDLLVQFVLLRFILGRLSAESYGIWVVTGGVFAYASVLQLGINSAVNYFVPSALVREDYADLDRTASTAILFYCCVSLVVLVATIVLGVYFPTWFHVPPDLVVTSRWIVAMVGGYFTFTIPLLVFQGVLSGMQSYVVMNRIRLGWRLARAVSIVLFLTFGWGLIGLGLAHVICRSAEAVTMPFVVRRELPQLRISIGSASTRELRRLLGYSIQTLLWSLSNVVRDRVSIVLAGALLSTAAATMYSIPLLIMQAMYGIVQSIAAVTKPAASALREAGSDRQLISLVLRGNRLVGLIVFPASAALVLLGRALIGVWFTDPQFVAAVPILMIMAVGESLTLAQMVSAYAMIGLGEQKPFARFALSTSLAGVGLMIILVMTTGLGLRGLALGGAIPAIIGGALFIPWYTARVLGCSMSTYLWASMLRPMLSAVPFAVVLYLVSWYIAPSSLVGLVGVVLLSTPAWIAGAYFIGLDIAERASVSRDGFLALLRMAGR